MSWVGGFHPEGDAPAGSPGEAGNRSTRFDSVCGARLWRCRGAQASCGLTQVRMGFGRLTQ